MLQVSAGRPEHILLLYCICGREHGLQGCKLAENIIVVSHSAYVTTCCGQDMIFLKVAEFNRAVILMV
jgi:hypothetical protein